MALLPPWPPWARPSSPNHPRSQFHLVPRWYRHSMMAILRLPWRSRKANHFLNLNWSGRPDLNRRHPAPKFAPEVS